MKRDHSRPPNNSNDASSSSPGTSPATGVGGRFDPSNIRVLHIITRMVRGGAQLVVRDLLCHTNNSRFRVALAAGPETGAEGSLWDEIEASPEIQIYRVPALQRAISPVRDLRAFIQLRRVIQRENPHVVHAHTSKAGLLGCLAARRERVPAIVLAPHGHIVAPDARIPGIPQSGIKRWLLGRAARYSAKLADRVIAPNDSERQDGIAHGMWTEENSITVANGIDTERFRPRDRDHARREAGWPEGRLLIGCVARLTEEKGVDIAVRAMAHLPEATLVLIGDGPDREKLQSLAEELGVQDRVVFHGLAADVAPLYPGLDLLVVPSRTEAHGLVAAEALSCEIPVVTSGVGGLRSLVTDGTTGLYFQKDNAHSLAEMASRLLADRELAARFGRAGRASVKERFSLSAMIEATERLYLKLLTESAAPNTESHSPAPAS